MLDFCVFCVCSRKLQLGSNVSFTAYRQMLFTEYLLRLYPASRCVNSVRCSFDCPRIGLLRLKLSFASAISCCFLPRWMSTPLLEALSDQCSHRARPQCRGLFVQLLTLTTILGVLGLTLESPAPKAEGPMGPGAFEPRASEHSNPGTLA